MICSEIIEIALKMLSDDLPVDKICKYTGLSSKEVGNLRHDIRRSYVAESAAEYGAAGRKIVRPRIVLIGGPNGAGKSTSAPELLQGSLKVDEFVNADTIAHGLSAFRADKAAVKAGRIMLSRLRDLASERHDFAFETTLSSRVFAPWILELKESGYKFSLLFMWLASSGLAIRRVAERVVNGGHNVPEDVIIRRYETGLQNFFRIYRPVADYWRFYDNSNAFDPVQLACGEGMNETIFARDTWNFLKEKYS